jgi:hypothetical protein
MNMVMDKNKKVTIFLFGTVGVLGTAALGCKKMATTDDDQQQIGSAIGEAMASLDESTQGGATTAMVPALPIYPILRTPDQLTAPAWRRALNSVLPSAYGAACWPSTFAACTSGVRSRQFDSCTLGLSTLSGWVTLTFSSPALCVVATDGDVVTRTANFTLTGPFGGTLAVTSPGGGQTLTKTAAGFKYEVGGMERVLTAPGGRMLADIGTRTTTPIAVTGSSRADLAIVSGALEVNHKLAGYTVTLVPSNLAWSSTCNCAVSGSLTGAVAGGKFAGKSASVELTGCGQADVTIDGDTQSVTLDRCAPI